MRASLPFGRSSSDIRRQFRAQYEDAPSPLKTQSLSPFGSLGAITPNIPSITVVDKQTDHFQRQQSLPRRQVFLTLGLRH